MNTFGRVAPVLPVRDVSAALAHYRKLGFEADAYQASTVKPVYGFLKRDGVHLHLTRVDDLDPMRSTSACYLYVDDANALFAEWDAAGVKGRLVAPEDTPYGLGEFAHVDPDGNLLRVGSEMKK
jgi:uncharacterized glyoxalase superfamily protein PhnB